MNEVQRVINLARSYVGYLEKKSNSQLESLTANAGSANYTVFAKKYRDYGFGDYQGQPWCAMAVTVLFYDALGKNKAEKILKPYAYCPYGVNDWKSKGRWHSRVSGYSPKVGDVIFFSNGAESTHTGIVYKCDGGRVYTYEGNTSGGNTLIPNGGAFCAKSYNLNYSRILGYGNPNWTLINEEEFDMEELKKLEARVKALEDKNKPEMIYNYIDKNMPEWAREAVKWCVDKGIVKGTNGKGDLGLNDMKLWVCVVVYRAAKLLGK